MENSTGVNPINCDNGSPLKHCIDLVTMLAGKGLRFFMSVKTENSFVFQLESKDAATAPKANKRSPSDKRRQEKRKLLRKKSDTFREKPGNTRDTATSTEVASPKKIAAASGSPLNLCPKPVHPRTSEGSVGSERTTTSCTRRPTRSDARISMKRRKPSTMTTTTLSRTRLPWGKSTSRVTAWMERIDRWSITEVNGHHPIQWWRGEKITTWSLIYHLMQNHC